MKAEESLAFASEQRMKERGHEERRESRDQKTKTKVHEKKVRRMNVRRSEKPERQTRARWC